MGTLEFCSLHGGGPFRYTMCLTIWSLVPPLTSKKCAAIVQLFFQRTSPTELRVLSPVSGGPLNSHVYNLMYVHAIETIHVFDICKYYEKFYAFIPKEKKVAYIIVYLNTSKAAKPQSTKFCERKIKNLFEISGISYFST
jgi:hypothetical protein